MPSNRRGGEVPGSYGGRRWHDDTIGSRWLRLRQVITRHAPTNSSRHHLDGNGARHHPTKNLDTDRDAGEQTWKRPSNCNGPVEVPEKDESNATNGRAWATRANRRMATRATRPRRSRKGIMVKVVWVQGRGVHRWASISLV
jgi:hypothetical protein